jgi:hypothetical protein
VHSTQITTTDLRRKSEVKLSDHRTLAFVAWLLEDDLPANSPVEEASVVRPRRGKIFIAAFTGSGGGQVWRSTGQTDYEAALKIARQWEAEARAKRARQPRTKNKPRTRVGPTTAGTGAAGLGMTQREVAELLKMSERGVREVERRAFEKLRRHPLLRQLWKQYLSGELDEEVGGLEPAETAALFDMARTAEELLLIEKVLRMIQR